MPPHVLDLALAGQCSDDALICTFVEQQTGNQTAADIADLLVGIPLALVGLFLLLVALRWVAHRLIERLVHRAEVGVLPYLSRFPLGPSRKGRVRGDRTHAEPPVEPVASARRAQRARTMGSVLKSISTGILAAVVVTMMLSEVGVDIAPIIASAGIVGVALGFGAQSLVKDFLSGIFMIVEDQYGVGDTVDLGEATGVVEAVTLRITRLRDVNGTVWYVPNGQIVRVGNQSQNWSRTVLDIGVAYSEDLVHVRQVLEEVAHGLWDDEDFREHIIEEPSVWGVQDLAADQVTMRLVLKTTPGSQFEVAREMRERIKARFDLEGIEIPFPQRVVWQRQAPPGAEPEASTPDSPAKEPPAQEKAASGTMGS